MQIRRDAIDVGRRQRTVPVAGIARAHDRLGEIQAHLASRPQPIRADNWPDKTGGKKGESECQRSSLWCCIDSQAKRRVAALDGGSALRRRVLVLAIVRRGGSAAPVM